MEQIFNYSRTKFEGIIFGRVGLFSAKLLSDRFDFSSDFYALDFFVSRDSSFVFIHKCQQLNSKWQQFTTKSQMKSAPKLEYFLLQFLLVVKIVHNF